MTSIERDHRCIGNEVVEQGLGADIVVLRCHSGRAEWALPRGCREAAVRRLRGDGPQAREAHRLSRHGERATCGRCGPVRFVAAARYPGSIPRSYASVEEAVDA